MFTKHNHTTEALTAAWLLPVGTPSSPPPLSSLFANLYSIAVPAITIAAVGPSLARLLITERNDLRYALTVLIASYINCGVGLLLACGIMTIYFQRLAVHHLPPREVIVSTFLPLGPCGQAGFALIELVRLRSSTTKLTRALTLPPIIHRVAWLQSFSLFSPRHIRIVPAWRNWRRWDRRSLEPG